MRGRIDPQGRNGAENPMRIGVSLPDPSGPDAQGRPPLDQVRDALRRAADDGFASAWLSNIFGLDALTTLAVAGHGVGGIELGTAVVPTYPRHPAALAQQALTVALALEGRLALGSAQPGRPRRCAGSPSAPIWGCPRRGWGGRRCSWPRWPRRCSGWPASGPTG